MAMGSNHLIDWASAVGGIGLGLWLARSAITMWPEIELGWAVIAAFLIAVAIRQFTRTSA
jgi:hypothetical protein